MKIHLRPPLPILPPTPALKPPATTIQLEMQANALIKTSRQQQNRLNTLYGARKDPRDSDEDMDSEPDEQDQHGKKNLDFFA